MAELLVNAKAVERQQSKIIEIKKYSRLKQKCNKFGVEQPLIKEIN